MAPRGAPGRAAQRPEPWPPKGDWPRLAGLGKSPGSLILPSDLPREITIG